MEKKARNHARVLFYVLHKSGSVLSGLKSLAMKFILQT